jgi:hypothetical protein
MVVSFRRRLATLCREPPFAECNPMPRVLLSANTVVTESRTLPSVALGKGTDFDSARLDFGLDSKGEEK